MLECHTGRDWLQDCFLFGFIDVPTKEEILNVYDKPVTIDEVLKGKPIPGSGKLNINFHKYHTGKRLKWEVVYV